MFRIVTLLLAMLASAAAALAESKTIRDWTAACDESAACFADQLFNYDYEPRTGWLHSFYKGRGIGDCGSTGTWTWNNDLFRLMEFQAWDACDESRTADDRPVVFKYKPFNKRQ